MALDARAELDRGWQLHQAGRLTEAAAIYPPSAN